MSSPLIVSLGTSPWGKYEAPGVAAPFDTLEKVSPLLDVFYSRGHRHIDTARIYGYGTAEELLAAAEEKHPSLVVSTKIFPTRTTPLDPRYEPYNLNEHDLKLGLERSLTALKSEKVETYFLYDPDRNVPLEETLVTLDKLYKEGRFARWGLIRHPAWLVARIQELCSANGWVKPTVYQGIYNPFVRGVETEVIPCIRHYGMSFEAAQPLGSGILGGRYRKGFPDSEHPKGGRFDPSHFIGLHLRHRYWHEPIFDALEMIEQAAAKHGLTARECAIRWAHFHSAIKPELGDRLILGAADAQQLSEVLDFVEAGPLPEDVVKAVDNSWQEAKIVN
ncbi:hypothetical protein E4T42_07920 [Aureobasidium subglaciale]|uniref:NADP-dependent oxidoreductase domain-containing protein n=1 Tax=Aureobasidium subglaciale (strain EXF-2481) TaxID=1043005 RepID=A0A074YZ75_AURSE|nr:uncharacterized protein AUEXF2481DRAFT_43515 [Aureobasidium subglaciale EXF-2481]KAI5207178.1 hypothetical protein E4T38_03345 [Aureobasidium subglaciale]KAI5226253.1 hypothetical protein E4T40_03278 [Aureobasidium subglaciale]KAI5229494.1 hypothetical protein E4T41_03342 [Aureobasidium subglaciale]KAI5241791.1 hypothetical protein E4T42_07920 [Aureobasidium subglaciale]KAI5264272.1 hypothetical protein E4T46_03120 [Aureobasidium subglaciale]